MRERLKEGEKDKDKVERRRITSSWADGLAGEVRDAAERSMGSKEKVKDETK